ncbi:hypothetical protein Tco_1036478 [Tanacetum coccineum]
MATTPLFFFNGLLLSDFEVSDDDNHSTAPTVNGNAPTTNAPSTLALPAEPPQKKPAFQMSAPEDFEVSDDDNHSTTPTVKGNAPTTNAASTLALPAEPPQKKQMSAHELKKTRLWLEPTRKAPECGAIAILVPWGRQNGIKKSKSSFGRCGVLLVAAFIYGKVGILRVFKAKNKSSSKVFQDIQIKMIKWINRRFKKHKFPWEKWVVRPTLGGKHQVMCDVAACIRVSLFHA